MPKVTLRNENEIIRAVREEIVVNPMISISRLRQNLKDRGIMTFNGNPIDPMYLGRLVRKISRKIVRESDQVRIGERLNNTRERFRVMIDRLMKIAFWKAEYIRDGIWPPDNKDIVKALDTIQKMDLALLQAEMDAGVFERHLGSLDVEIARKMPIPDDKREAVWAVFKNFGMIPKGDNPQIKDGGKNNTIEQPCRAIMVIEQPA